MTESSWQRLYRLTEARRSEKGLTRNEIHALGGPSTETMRKLAARSGPPTLKQRPALNSIDRVLGWPTHTSWRIANGALDDAMNERWLADEDDRLVHMPDANPVESEFEQMVRDFTSALQVRLRGMPEDEALALMAQVGAELGLLGQHRPNG